MVGWRLVLRWRVWEERLSILGEVLAAIGGIEAFGKNDEVRAGFGCFEDAGASAREVVGFVGT